MKTYHRMVYEVLTPQEYKNFCANTTPEGVKRVRDDHCRLPHEVVNMAFQWSRTKEGFAFWNDIFERLKYEHA